MADISFTDAFTENMQALGLPVPASLFANVTTALSTISAMVGALKLLGAGATMAELATSLPLMGMSSAGLAAAAEVLAVAGACSAAFYLGAMIGSVLVATWRSNAHEFGIVLQWAKTESERLGQNLIDIVNMILNNLNMSWPNLMRFF